MADEQTNGQSAAQGTEASVQDLQNRIAELEKEAADYKDNWLRAAADYKNYKRRADQERIDLINRASAGLLLKLLPVMDDLDRAVASITPDVEATPWYGGFRLIPQKLQTILESEGVSAIAAQDQEFDPNLHEAVIFEDGDGSTTRVVAELQKGYKLRDKVLRPAMVKVGRS